ncbi:hypothetical protein JTE90_005349 [Oedothorax gibbosus]|uniref:Uncharacterized protein n=1 Tax=Oedothorax gibbosus TaxID=931172 RepID=A0AAV6UL16_9ARAC|nr:hypothetical protein JTE90_005349 [Oedothorax gibbosus]
MTILNRTSSRNKSFRHAISTQPTFQRAYKTKQYVFPPHPNKFGFFLGAFGSKERTTDITRSLRPLKGKHGRSVVRIRPHASFSLLEDDPKSGPEVDPHRDIRVPAMEELLRRDGR